MTEIRGFDSESVVANLAERGLIERLKARGENRERRWKVTRRFLDAFNLNRVEELYEDAVFGRVFPELAEADGESAIGEIWT